MKNKIVISIGSLLACIALVSVLIAAVGPPPILRNAMTTNQNVWEKSGSSMTWTGNVAVAGTVSAGSGLFGGTNVIDSNAILEVKDTNHTFSMIRITSPSSLDHLLLQYDPTGGLVACDYAMTFHSGHLTNIAYTWMIYDDMPTQRGYVPYAQMTTNGSTYWTWVTSTNGFSGGTYSGTQVIPSGGMILSGDVGIGTPYTTNGNLNVYGTKGICIDSPNSASPLDFRDSGVFIGRVGKGNYAVSGGDSTGIGIGSQGYLDFATGGNTRKMRLDTSGNLSVSNTVNATNGFAVAAQTGISCTNKVILQDLTTNLMVWEKGICVSNIANYHD